MQLLTKHRVTLILIGIVALFVILRLPLIHAPYHQDEYKWPMYANPALMAPGSVPHPPLTEFIYKYTRVIFGDDNFRLTPFFFSLVDIVLLYVVVKRRYGQSTAIGASLLFATAFFGILASITVDTDGAILPFFFLVSLWLYDSFMAIRTTADPKKYLWLGLMALVMLMGLMVKLSFIIGVGAIILDYIITERRVFNRRRIIMLAASLLAAVGVTVLVLYVSQFIFEGFTIARGLHYWETFFRGVTNRNYLQTAIQVVKGVLYLSPLLVLAGILGLRRLEPLKLFYIFIGAGLVFYLVIFDFSIGALDRYLAFLVLPLCVIAGYLLGRVDWKSWRSLPWWSYGVAIISALVVFGLQFLPHVAVPVYPKAEWVHRIVFGPWNFLFSFSGGSGPLPFYVSWLYIIVSWLLVFGLAIIAFKLRGRLKQTVIVTVCLLGIVYNFTLYEELTFGRINGSARQLVYWAADIIQKDSEIKQVIVYNDNGGYEIKKTGKYARRMYAVPSFEAEYRKIFSEFDGHVLVINAPPIYPNSFYTDYLATCQAQEKNQSGKIDATIYRCRPTIVK